MARTQAFVILSLLIVSAFLLIESQLTYRRRRAMQRVARAQETRAYFAEVRIKLMSARRAKRTQPH